MTCIRVVCLLCASLMTINALAQDLSGWSDKTVCRLVATDGGSVYVTEASSRGLKCKEPSKVKNIKPKSKSANPIYRFGGISEIPEDANPNYETLRFYLYRYLYSNNIYAFCGSKSSEYYCEELPPRRSYLVEPSKSPYIFQSDLRDDKYIKQQMEHTPLLSYLLYEDGKIVIDEITPMNRFGDMFRDSSKLHSQSVAKSLISYVVGHAICEGYIESIDSRLDDWPVLKNTLYHDQSLIDVLNMSSGSQNYFNGSNAFLNSNRSVTSPTVQDIMENELRGSKKTTAKYSYNNLNPGILGSYLIYKIGYDPFQQLLDDVFQKKARVKSDVFFLSNENAKKNQISIWAQFHATRYDYLRIAKAMLDDWQNDTCVGQYLKTIHDRRIAKGNWGGSGDRVSLPESYGGFFHTGYKGMKNRPVMGMDGFGGQTITIDFERGRIVATQAIHDNMKFPKSGSFNWKKIVYQVIKNGEPDSTSNLKQVIEPVMDSQQIISERETDQEVERLAKKYWDSHYDAMDTKAQRLLWGGSADGSIMFSEDFETEGQRAIRVDDRNNAWEIKKEIHGNSIYCNKVASSWSDLNLGSVVWSDYSIEYKAKFVSSEFGYSLETHIRKAHDREYNVNMNSHGGVRVNFNKRSEGISKLLANGYVSFKPEQWLDAKVIVSGENITYLIDGQVIAKAKDNSEKKGAPFFAASPNSQICLDNIVVNKI